MKGKLLLYIIPWQSTPVSTLTLVNNIKYLQVLIAYIYTPFKASRAMKQICKTLLKLLELVKIYSEEVFFKIRG